MFRALLEQNATNRLPIPEPGKFGGNPLAYPCWRHSFNTHIDRKGIPLGEKIHYLKMYLKGAALECVEGYFFAFNR